MLITIKLNNEEISGVQRLARWRSDPKVEKYGKHRNSTELKASKEIAYRKNYIDEEQLRQLAEPLIKNGYGQYLMGLIDNPIY